MTLALFLKDPGPLLPAEQFGGEADFTTPQKSRRPGMPERGVTVKIHVSTGSCKPAQLALCIGRHRQLATVGAAVVYLHACDSFALTVQFD